MGARPSQLAHGGRQAVQRLHLATRLPGARALAVSSIPGRLAFAMMPLAIVLHVQRQTQSFTVAGVATAGFGLASAVLAPWRARRVARAGELALWCFALLTVSFLVLLSLAVELLRASPFAVDVESTGRLLLVVAAVATGATAPPLSALVRTRWSAVATSAPDARQAVFGLDGTLEEALYVIGPASSSLIVSLISSRAALWAIGLLLVIATAALARGEHGSWQEAPGAGALAANTSARSRRQRRGPGPAARWATASIACLGAFIGLIDLAVTAVAVNDSRASLAGVYLSVFAVGSLLGGLAYASASPPSAPLRRTGTVMALGAISVVPLLAFDGGLILVPFVLLAGLPVSAVLTSSYTVIHETEPEARKLESFTWLTTANNTGIALGSALSGLISATIGPRYAIMAAVVSLAAGAALSRLGGLRT